MDNHESQSDSLAERFVLLKQHRVKLVQIVARCSS